MLAMEGMTSHHALDCALGPHLCSAPFSLELGIDNVIESDDALGGGGGGRGRCR